MLETNWLGGVTTFTTSGFDYAVCDNRNSNPRGPTDVRWPPRATTTTSWEFRASARFAARTRPPMFGCRHSRFGAGPTPTQPGERRRAPTKGIRSHQPVEAGGLACTRYADPSATCNNHSTSATILVTVGCGSCLKITTGQIMGNILAHRTKSVGPRMPGKPLLLHTVSHIAPWCDGYYNKALTDG